MIYTICAWVGAVTGTLSLILQYVRWRQRKRVAHLNVLLAEGIAQYNEIRQLHTRR